jgi:hypothetical protein
MQSTTRDLRRAHRLLRRLRRRHEAPIWYTLRGGRLWAHYRDWRITRATMPTLTVEDGHPVVRAEHPWGGRTEARFGVPCPIPTHHDIKYDDEVSP